MKNNPPFKKLVIVGIIFCLIIVVILGFIYSKLLSSFNPIVLALTLITLMWYAYDTHRIADQAIEANLRPVILRSGYIHSWKDIKFEYEGNKIKSGKPIQFTILKNIATDIRGYIIIDNYKHELLFGNEISKVGEGEAWLGETWGWMKPETLLYAAFLDEKKKKTIEDNKIYIEYKDVENNKYFTIEDENFCQKSFKV